jgi:hypothetical protein
MRSAPQLAKSKRTRKQQHQLHLDRISAIFKSRNAIYPVILSGGKPHTLFLKAL